jgi:hypothetical protein
VDEAHETYRGVRAGHVSDVYPARSRIDQKSFGICLCALAVMASAGLYETSGVSKPLIPNDLWLLWYPTLDSTRAAAYPASRVSRCSTRPSPGCSPR